MLELEALYISMVNYGSTVGFNQKHTVFLMQSLKIMVQTLNGGVQEMMVVEAQLMMK